ncbi:hypothetical protein Tco_0554851 [Tanacetum coccineum]
MEEDHAGSNPGQSHVVQARPNPKPMHEDFVAIVYPQVHESLKLAIEEHVHIENLPSLSGILSSMKNLGDAFTFGDQFLNDKPSEEEPGKANDKTTQALSSRVYTLENHDLYLKIDKYINEVVKEAVHNTLQALNRERFRDLSEIEMKEILHDRMFESGSYTSHLEHTTLYEALEASVDHENREEFNEEMAKSHKRRPWKTSDTREAPSSSSKQKFDSLSKQPVDDVPIPDDVHLLDSKDTGVAHHLKIKTRLGWLKPLPEEEAPETLKPDWVIPPNDLPEIENNWEDALAKTYKDPEENKLLQKIRDMGSFINWYCKQIRKLKLVKADLEDQIDLLNPEGNRVVYDISKPLPLGGPPGDKERRNALSISKLKAAYYPDFRLKELVLSLWIESECDYNISVADVYKLNHLSGADKVHLFNAINLWIRNIVIRQRVEDVQLGIKSYQTKLNLTQPRWDETDFLFKEDYTIVHKPRAVIYRDRNNQKTMMRETEVHKFSDGTLTRILEKLDVMVKVYVLFKFNTGMKHRIWSEDDKRRS